MEPWLRSGRLAGATSCTPGSNKDYLDTTQRIGSSWVLLDCLFNLQPHDWYVSKDKNHKCCLIIDIWVGTGIFNSASIVFTNTQSIGLSLLLWAFGAILALSGVIVYIEYGLTIPRWPFGLNGEKISTPRSGDAKNYVCTQVRIIVLFNLLTTLVNFSSITSWKSLFSWRHACLE